MKLMSVTLLTLLSVATFAGGSASKKTILNMVDFDLAWHLSQSFYLSDQGSCLRAGNHLPNGGERLLPCELEAVAMYGQQRYLITLDSDGQSYTATKL